MIKLRLCLAALSSAYGPISVGQSVEVILKKVLQNGQGKASTISDGVKPLPVVVLNPGNASAKAHLRCQIVGVDLSTMKVYVRVSSSAESAETPLGTTIPGSVLSECPAYEGCSEDAFVMLDLHGPPSKLGVTARLPHFNCWENNQAEAVLTRGKENQFCTLERLNDLVLCQVVDALARPGAKSDDRVTVGSKITNLQFSTVAGGVAFFKQFNRRFCCRLINWSTDLKECLGLLNNPPNRGTTVDRVATMVGPFKRKDQSQAFAVAPISFLAQERPIQVGDLLCAEAMQVLRGQTPCELVVRLPGEANRGLLHRLSTDEGKLPSLERSSARLLQCRVVGRLNRPELGDQKHSYFMVSTRSADLQSYQLKSHVNATPGETLPAIVKHRCPSGLVVSPSSHSDLLLPVPKFAMKPLADKLAIGGQVKICVVSPQVAMLQGSKRLHKTLFGQCLRDLFVHLVEHAIKPVGVDMALLRKSMDLREAKIKVEATQVGKSDRKRAAEPADDLEEYAEFDYEPMEMEAEERESEDLGPSKKKKKKKTSKQKKESLDPVEQELQVQAKESAKVALVANLLSGAGDVSIKGLQTTEELELAVRNRPNDASIWTQFMLHHATAGDVKSARLVAERGLTGLSRTPGKESDRARATILLVLASLESRLLANTSSVPLLEAEEQHGRLQDAVKRLTALDQTWALRRLCDHLAEQELFAEAEEVAKGLVKRSSAKEPADWLTLIRVRLRAGKTASAREAEANAGRLLRSSDLANFACNVAQLELAHGDVDRALKLFEEQIRAHPQRKQIHLAYLKALVECGRMKEAKLASVKAVESVKGLTEAAVNAVLTKS